MLHTNMALALMLLLLTTWSQPIQPFLFAPPPADIVPVDALVFIGETLRMECSLTDPDSYSSSDMYINIYSGPGRNWRVPLENTTVVNSATISVAFVITEAFTYRNTVECYAGDSLLRTTFLFAERPIQNITNFGGVALYDKSISVTWDLGQEYLGGDDINVSVDWNQGSPPNMSGNPCNHATNQSCTIEDYIAGYIYFFRIVVNSKKGSRRPSEEYLTPLFDTSATSVQRFDVIEHRKTGPPSRFRVVNKTSNCMTLAWDDPLYFESCKCNSSYMINVTEKSNQEVNMTYMGIKEASSPANDIEICDLKPYTEYMISVQLRDLKSIVWSDADVTEGKTEEDRPLTGPPLTETSYFVTDCKDNKRKLYLYWNDPEPSILQGELTEYKVVMDNRVDTLRAGSNYFQQDLNCDSAYDISVYAVTKVGESHQPSTVHIPVQDDTIPVSNDMAFLVQEMSSPSSPSLKDVNITWEPNLAGQENVTFVVYMCRAGYLDYTCLNNFDVWEFYSDTQTWPVKGLQVSSEYLFGYAMVGSDKRKRGIQWTNCVYRANKVPNPPTGVLVTHKERNSLQISWTAERCNKDTKVFIERYHIFICPSETGAGNLNTACSHYESDGSTGQNTYTATGVITGKKQYVYVEAESPAGVSEPSSPGVFTPPSSTNAG